MSKILFFSRPGQAGELRTEITTSDLVCRVFRPSLLRATPKGTSFYHTRTYWAFHHLRIFKSANYRIVLIYDTRTRQLVHHTYVFPSFFRFPFMDKDDVQVGNIWTRDDFRGRGLAKHAVSLCLSATPSAVKTWYLCNELNSPSISLARKLEFYLTGYGEKVSGHPSFYRITSHTEHHP